MERDMIRRIGPVCRFGPGGDYESVWPGDWMEEATHPKNAIGRLLDVVAGMTDMLRGSQRNIEIIGPMDIGEGTAIEEIQQYGADERRTGVRRGAYAEAGSVTKRNRRFSEQPGLFADDRRAGGVAGRKPNYRIRTHRAVAKKRACFEPAGQGTLFELDFKGAKTA
jgi:hypothetical protein